MTRIGIIGGTGYTALELLKLLAFHPQVDVTSVTSRDPDSPSLASVHGELFRTYDLTFELLEIDSFAKKVDFAFSCLPHAASAPIVMQLADRGIKVVDFSADYRLNDVATFEHWYGVEHPDRDRVGAVVYGLPEWFRSEIREASLVANPGCFPTSALLPLMPLVKNQVINPQSIIVDSKTGVSGAGRKANLKFHYPECNESITAYGVGTHRHAPEMEHLIQRVCGSEPRVTFTPHLTPMNRGILSTIYVNLDGGSTIDDIRAAWDEAYRDEPFVRIVDQLPATRHVAGTNYCDFGVFAGRTGPVIVSVIDNLVKGASGAAVQNMNLMLGYEETTGLVHPVR